MTTKTTNYLHLTYRDRARTWLSQRDPIAMVSMLLIVPIVGLALLRQFVSIAPIAAAVPTPQLPIIMIATARAEPMPTAVPPIQMVAQLPTNTLARAVVAYDRPNGSVIGAIEQGRAYQVLARFGADWLQADVSGSGAVWLRSSDVLDLPSDLVDLQPPPAPQVIYQVVSAPAVELEAPSEEQPAEELPAMPPQYMVLADRQQWAVEAQAAHQAEMALPVAPPATLVPMAQNDVTQEWARQQYLSEHPEAKEQP